MKISVMTVMMLIFVVIVFPDPVQATCQYSVIGRELTGANVSSLIKYVGQLVP